MCRRSRIEVPAFFLYETKHDHECDTINSRLAPAKKNCRDQIIPPLLRLQPDRIGPLNWNPVRGGRHRSQPPGAKSRQLELEPGGPIPECGPADRSIGLSDECHLRAPGGLRSPRILARPGVLFVWINLRAQLRATRRGHECLCDPRITAGICTVFRRISPSSSSKAIGKL